MRDPNTTDSRIYVGHLNESVTKEILEFKFSMYGNIQGFLRTQPGFCFIQYDQPSSAANAITNEDGSVLNNNRILVKSAAMKKAKELKNSTSLSEPMESEDTIQIPESLNKKYFSEGNEYYGKNSITASVADSDINHCEIVVVSRPLTKYAEDIERQLKMLGIKVDLLFPNDEVPIFKVLGNIQLRGCWYSILITPQNEQNRSITLTILYGDATEHRNIPLDDAIRFVYKDFTNKTRGITNIVYQHPDHVQTLLKTLAANRSLTVLQYDHIIKYLKQRREIQVSNEIGENNDNVEIHIEKSVHRSPPTEVIPTPVISNAINSENDLQMKILEILKKKPLIKSLKRPLSTPLGSNVEDVKSKLMKDEKVKKAMSMLLGKEFK
ncbi:unnamed protein product [Diamesa serratosioi]